jgi:hypothetical protein
LAPPDWPQRGQFLTQAEFEDATAAFERVLESEEQLYMWCEDKIQTECRQARQERHCMHIEDMRSEAMRRGPPKPSVADTESDLERLID